MQNAFGQTIQKDPNWKNINKQLIAIQKATPNAFLIDLVTGYENTGYQMQIGPAGKGTYATGKNITIDANMFKVDANHNPKMTTADINAFFAAISHEIGHALNPDENQRKWMIQGFVTDAEARELDNEAYAYADMYRATKPLGIPLSIPPNAVGGNLQTILDNLLQSHGGNVNHSYCDSCLG
jgi:hypothetical protein